MWVFICLSVHVLYCYAGQLFCSVSCALQTLSCNLAGIEEEITFQFSHRQQLIWLGSTLNIVICYVANNSDSTSKRDSVT